MGLRDAALVADFELRDSLRSRKALALLVLYTGGAAAGAGIFVSVLREAENAVARQLGVPETERAGTLTKELVQSQEFIDALVGLVGDPEVARTMLAIPPLALFYGWLALGFVPSLVVLTSADAIASELSSGSVRFAIFRTDRLSWAVGKLLGQAALLGVGVLAGAAATFAVGAASLANFDAMDHLRWLLAFSLRAGLYGFAWLGMATGVSQLTRSVGGARALGLLGLVALGIGSLLTDSEILSSLWSPDTLPDAVLVAADTLHQLFPAAHKDELWRPELVRQLSASAMLVALGAAGFGLGHLRLSRMDA